MGGLTGGLTAETIIRSKNKSILIIIRLRESYYKILFISKLQSYQYSGTLS